MQVGALFAGIGGMELGLHRAGHYTEMTCEVWEPAIGVLASQFEGVPNKPDVRELKLLPKKVDLLTAGFPCQDLSQAGNTAGIGGKKSGLIHHVFRLLDRRKVPMVVLENVSFMLQLDKGAAMNRLTTEFEQRGYRWAYRIVNSLSFLPQRRERVFFVASCCDLDPQNVLFADDATPPDTVTRLRDRAHGFYWTEGTRGLGWADDAIPTLKNGSTIGIASPPAILMPDGRLIKPDIRDAERLQGFPEDWTASAPLKFRWSLVGNAVSVPVAEWLGGRLAEPGFYFGEKDMEWPKRHSWPRAAYFNGSARTAVKIGAFPVWKKREPLHKFLRHEGTPLSIRGTAGFFSRAENSNLYFVPGFLNAVRRHLRVMESGAAPTPAPRKAPPKRVTKPSKQPALIAAE